MLGGFPKILVTFYISMSEQDCMLETAASEYKSLEVAINPDSTKASSDIESMCNKAELLMYIVL